MKVNPETKTFAEAIAFIKEAVNNQSRLPKAICFDYFDTLVFRVIAPEYSKKLAAKQLSLLLDGITGDSIYEIRRELELKLCRESVEQGKDPEFTARSIGVEKDAQCWD